MPRSERDGWIGWRELIKRIKSKNAVSNNVRPSKLKKSRHVTNIVRQHRPDYYIVLFMGLLMLLGLVVMFSISPQIINATNNASGREANPYYFFIKQLIAVFVCIIAFVCTSKIPLDFWRNKLNWLLLIGFGLSALLFLLSKINPEAVCSLGACRWLRFGPVSLQVSEVLKFSLLVFMAFFWSYFANQQNINSKNNLLYSGLVIGVSLFIVVVLQKDLGTGGVLAIMLAFMFWMTGAKKRYLLIVGLVGLLAGVAAIIAQPYRINRVRTFFGGDSAAMSDTNRHIIEAKIALGSGGLFGLGVGNSIQSAGYLPEAVNDSIFAIIGEVFGFVGSMVVVTLFVGLLWRLLRNILYSHNLLARLILVGVFGWIFAHFVINIASMTGLMPMTGITLPFLSYGGTSMIFAAAALGLAFQMSAYTAHVPYYSDNGEKSD